MLYRDNNEIYKAESMGDLTLMLYQTSRARKPDQTLESWMLGCAGRVEALYGVTIDCTTPERFAEQLVTLGLLNRLH